MYISHLRLENIRGFRELELDFTGSDGKPRMRTLVIGKNGTCKTTLLRALALGVCDLADGDALLAEPTGKLVQGSGGVIELSVTAKGVRWDLVTGVISADQKEVVNRANLKHGTRPTKWSSDQVFICGYGAGRSSVGSSTDAVRKYRVLDSVRSLFTYTKQLSDPELTLRRLKDFMGTARYERTLHGIKRALELSEIDEIRLPDGGGVEIAGPSIGVVPLEGWADGYRLTFSWLLDFYAWAMRADRITEDGTVPGILLIDELEQHLHPSLQAELLPRLTKLLPDTQIIATTHSPVVALSAKPEELVVLRREGDEVIADTSHPDFSGYSVEDMLVDEELFDAEAYGPETNRKLARYHELVAIERDERTETQRDELRKLAQELREQQLPEVRQDPTAKKLRELIQKHGL